MKRVIEHPVLDTIDTEQMVTIYFNKTPYSARSGETVAAALMANGVKKLRENAESKKARGVYCNIGHCFECRVYIEKQGVVRACLTPVFDGMRIESASEGVGINV